MRTLIAFAVALVALAPAAMAATTAVHNDSFDIQLPDGFSGFEEKAQSSASEGTTMETRSWISKAPTGEAVIVTVSRMSGTILDPARLMESTRASLLKSLNASVETVEPVTGAIPASRAVFRSNGPTPVFLRSFMAVRGDSLYQLLYVGRSEEQRSAATVNEMFDAFRLAPLPETSSPAPAGIAGSN